MRTSRLLVPAVLRSAAALGLEGSPVAAQTVVKGDAIKLNGTIFDLLGIEAPEIHQICKTGYLAGIVAAIALTELTREKAVTCEFRGSDADGRVLGLCRANGKDLSKAMVKIGMAWANRNKAKRNR
jgi:endonuclease YncB( thermonuclease family)